MMRNEDIENPEDQVQDTMTAVPKFAEVVSPSLRKRSWGYIIGQIILVIFCFIGVTVLVFIFIFGSADLTQIFAPANDPPGLDGTEGVWKTTGNQGLELVVENALDEEWVPYFDEYIARWDQGSPDALTLSTRRVNVDPDCNPTRGMLKVCNGNYGAQDWKGINLSLVQDGYMLYSVAKMNDFYLPASGQNLRRYTMCHEVGHGFGLQHTDENYFNANRGDCMDYTSRVNTNLSPGDYNHDLLAQIYGTVPPAVRHLQSDDSILPLEVMKKSMDASHDIENSQHCAGDRAGVCIHDLGDGYEIIAHKLLVVA